MKWKCPNCGSRKITKWGTFWLCGTPAPDDRVKQKKVCAIAWTENDIKEVMRKK